MKPKISIKFTNTFTQKKEIFAPLKEEAVSIYTCGITPYDYSHIGHARCYITADVLVRLFKFLDYKVTHVRNYTDIDDKLLKKAEEQGDINSYKAIAEKFILAYQDDMNQLNCLVPNVEPRVTQHIPQIIEFIEGLIAKKNAYVIDGDVYFNISTFSNYGKLSKKILDELESGSRVKIDTRKKNPGDFALWKASNEHFWKSPWGYGRPGWHIECSVLAKIYLGETIDIHTGGMDLIFPHHENEIAQSESLHNTPFVHYWIHNAFVNINKEKMSKSLGNIVTLKDLFKTIDPMVLRYYLLQHHYRTPLDFNPDELEGVKTAYKKLVTKFDTPTFTQEMIHCVEQFSSLGPIFDAMLEAICDDVNTPKLLGLVFQHLDTITESPDLTYATKALLHDILGLSLSPVEEEQVKITPEIQALIDQREEARAAQDWTRADQLRDQLAQLGIKIQDKKL
ncbi:MAG: cysteine--tRNA ligase [bacterium]